MKRFLRHVRRTGDALASVGSTMPANFLFQGRQGDLLMALLVMGPWALFFGFYNAVAALLPHSALEQWLRLHAIAVAFGIFVFMLTLMAVAYMSDDGMAD